MMTREEHTKKLNKTIEELKMMQVRLDIIQSDAINAPSTLMKANYRETIKDAIVLIELSQKNIERAIESAKNISIWETK